MNGRERGVQVSVCRQAGVCVAGVQVVAVHHGSGHPVCSGVGGKR